jgi:hypothetical protein
MGGPDGREAIRGLDRPGRQRVQALERQAIGGPGDGHRAHDLAVAPDRRRDRASALRQLLVADGVGACANRPQLAAQAGQRGDGPGRHRAQASAAQRTLHPGLGQAGQPQLSRRGGVERRPQPDEGKEADALAQALGLGDEEDLIAVDDGELDELVVSSASS